MKIGGLLAHLDELETAYAGRLRESAGRYPDDHDVHHQCRTFADEADRAARRLVPLRHRYDGTTEWTADVPGHGGTLLEELRSLYLLADEVAVTWVMASQAARAARDAGLKEIAADRHTDVLLEARWFLTRIQASAAQALVTE